MSKQQCETNAAEGQSSSTVGLERMHGALKQIADMPEHAGGNMRQLAGDAIGLAPLGDRECHGCINGFGNHSTSCSMHHDQTSSQCAQWRWRSGSWVRDRPSR